jgi:Phage terminase large subunit/Terminase RNaseH-like domain
MRQSFCRRLTELERIRAAALQAGLLRARQPGAEVLRELVGRYGLETVPGESLTETIGRAGEILPIKLGCLLDPSRHKVIYGGRGSAKSWSVARALLILGAVKPLRILCAREFQNSLADSVHRLLSDQVEALGLAENYEVQKAGISGSNGTSIVFAGLRHNVSKIKSFEGVDIVWVEEGQTVSKNSWDVLMPTIRKPGSEIWVTFNPDLEEDDTYQRFVVWPLEKSIVREMNWSDNDWFPEELRAEKDHLKARDLDAYYNVWEGRCRSHVIGALWNKEIFEASRQARPDTEEERAALLATLRRVVIAVDPSGCAGEDDKRSDEIGIVAVGVGHDGIGRILEDATGRYSPDGWANKALELFDRWKADRIVAEKNFGGAMVESTIRTARRTAPVKLLNASRGKVQRAEPVAALYAQGKVRHVGHFPELERQQCLFSTAGYVGPRSPDHADAAIWGLTELMLEPAVGEALFEYYGGLLAEKAAQQTAGHFPKTAPADDDWA